MEKISAVISLMACAVISGCMCTVTSREYSIPEVKDEVPLSYKQVSDITSLREWKSTTLPIEVSASSRKGASSKDNNVLLWVLTVGVIPGWNLDEYIYSVNVKTPIGMKSGFCIDTERAFLGWVPYLLPFSSTSTGLGSPTEELTRRIVAQFKAEWTEAKVAELNAAERRRVDAKRTQIETLMQQARWGEAIRLCEGESDNRIRSYADIASATNRDWLAKMAKEDARAGVKAAADKRLVEITLNVIAKSTVKEWLWLADVAKSDTHTEVKTAADKKLTEIITSSSDVDWLWLVTKSDTQVEVQAKADKRLVEITLNDISSSKAKDWLEELVKNDTHAEVRAAADKRLVAITLNAIAASTAQEWLWLAEVAKSDAHVEVKTAADKKLTEIITSSSDVDWLGMVTKSDTQVEVQAMADKRLVAITLTDISSSNDKDWLMKIVKSDTHAELKTAADKRLVEMTLTDIALSTDKDWLTRMAREDRHAEVCAAAKKRISEIVENEKRLAREAKEREEARRKAALEALRRERAERVAAIAEGSLKRIRHHAGSLARWTEPRLGLSDEDKLAGESRLEEFGTKYLPNAYANFKKARDAAKKLQQVVNEEFPRPWTINDTSPEWNVFNKVLEKFARARAEYFLCHDELCHYWLQWRLGFVNAKSLAAIDSQKLVVPLLEDDIMMVDYQVLEATPMKRKVSDFAAKYAPESYAIYQQLSRELTVRNALLEEVLTQCRQMDFVQGNKALAAAVKIRDDIIKKLDALSSSFQEWRIDQKTAEKKAEDIAKCDHETALQLKPFVDTLPLP